MILWFVAAILVLVSYVLSLRQYDTTLDINIHDTYIVISYTHVFRFLAFSAAICAIGYWILLRFNRKPFFWLTLSHLVMSFVVILWFLFEFSFICLQDVPDHYNHKTEFSSGADIFMILFLFPVAQLIYVLNILISIFLKNKKNLD